jgi:hypothetical protein
MRPESMLDQNWKDHIRREVTVVVPIEAIREGLESISTSATVGAPHDLPQRRVQEFVSQWHLALNKG